MQVRETTMKKRPRPIQYLLSVDRTLRKLSLKRMVARGEKVRRTQRRHDRTLSNPQQPTASQRRRPQKNATPSSAPAIGAAIIVLSVIGIIVTGGFLAARQAFHTPDAPIALPSTPPLQTATMPAAAVSDAKATVPRAKQTAVVGAKEQAAAAIMTRTMPPERAEAAKSAPRAAITRQPDTAVLPATEAAAARPREIPRSAAPAQSDTDESAFVTVIGCLEVTDTGFRLKDTSGADALAARSWRTGFLRKRPAPIDLVDAASTLELPARVGQRVSATGTLLNHELRARSLQSVSGSCR